MAAPIEIESCWKRRVDGPVMLCGCDAFPSLVTLLFRCCGRMFDSEAALEVSVHASSIVMYSTSCIRREIANKCWSSEELSLVGIYWVEINTVWFPCDCLQMCLHAKVIFMLNLIPPWKPADLKPCTLYSIKPWRPLVCSPSRLPRPRV